jgi:hypothetical protein
VIQTAKLDKVPQIFICYAHEDNESPDPSKRWLERLLKQLAPLKLQEMADIWSDQEIELGEEWHKKIQETLQNVKAAVLLVSDSFLASEYIRSNELPVLLKNANDRGVVILPVLLRQCLWQETNFKYPDPKAGPDELSLSSIQMPTTKPLNSLREHKQDVVLYNVAKRIHQLIKGEDTNRIDIRHTLARARVRNGEITETLLMPSSEGVIRVEKGRIINYDFVPLVNKLNEVLDCFGKEGALAFKIRLENTKILEEYVIPRIKQELKSKIVRINPCEWEEQKILIDQLDLKACGDRKEQLIENVFIDSYKEYHQLTDWLNDSKSDLLLIVNNSHISDTIQIEEIAEQCWQTIHTKISPLLINKSRCFVTIFAHSFPGITPYINDSNDELDKHKIIPLPLKKLKVDNLEKWFRDEFHEWGLREEKEHDHQRIEEYLKRIKEPCGDVSKTFEEIQKICWELQTKRRIIFNAK